MGAIRGEQAVNRRKSHDRAGDVAAGPAVEHVLEAIPAGPQLAMAYSNLSQLHMLAGEDVTIRRAALSLFVKGARPSREVRAGAPGFRRLHGVRVKQSGKIYVHGIRSAKLGLS